MANISSFFYWYRRYKVRAQDMTDFQTALSDQVRAYAEGLNQAAVLKGMEVSASGMQLSVSAGVCVGPSGYVGVMTSVKTATAVAPTGSLPVRSLLVSRPLLLNSVPITKPTSPFEPVHLRQEQDTEVLIIQGAESATPDYPAKGANDVVLAGLRIAPGQSTFAAEDFDYEVRDHVGKNGSVAQNVFRFDDRLRPYRSGPKVAGIKPSQTSGPRPLSLMFAGRGSASLFPKDGGGEFNAADTFLNFETGVISGGDAFSPDFAPSVPTGNNSLVATVVLLGDDSLAVRFGIQGTLSECYDGIRNQRSAGAGAIDLSQANYKIAYVILTSRAGALSDIEVIDARALGGGSGSGSGVTLNWLEGSGSVPVPDVENGARVYLFTPGDGQELHAALPVPSSYAAGAPLSALGKVYTPGITGNIGMKIEATLIRTGVDPMTDTTNQRITTNAAFTVPGTADVPTEVEFDLSDSAGKINGVAISPGDQILCRLYRDSGTNTDDTRVLTDSFEVKLS